VYRAYIQQGLSIRKSCRGLLDSIDDRGQELALAECIRLTGIDRATWLAHIRKWRNWRKTCRKDEKGRWLLRLRSVQTVILKYRYGRLGTRTGKRWNDQELSVLALPVSHAEAAAALNRSYDSVKVKRCKERCYGRL